MKDRKDETLNKTKDEQVIEGVVDGKELSDERIKQVTGGTNESDYPCRQ